MREAYANKRPLRRGAKGLAVRLMQAGLIQLGIPLPGSIKTGGIPDGDFGADTERAVISFQRSRKLKDDGVAGTETIGALDAALFKPVKPPPPAPRPILMSQEYKLGMDDPPYRSDHGAGTWKSKSVELSYLTLYASLDAALAVGVFYGKDATNHLRHYLTASGRDYAIDLEAMLREVPSAKYWYELEVDQARSFVESLPDGTYQITSRQTQSGYNRDYESKNWYFAIGGYHVWGRGTAVVRAAPGGRRYELDFTYLFKDQYNWDGGKQVEIEIPGKGDPLIVTDKFMGEFHRQGLAKEYLCIGSLRRRFSWSQGSRIARDQLYARSPGGRA